MVGLWSKLATKMSVETVAAEMRLSKVTVIDWLVFCREVCRNFNNQNKIGGPGYEVEIDEHYVYTPMYWRGRKMKTQLWIVGGICRETSDIFMVVTGK
ncbi:hypothetical protein B4U80_02071, partial [Leptotrombidium deliense]